MRAELARLEAGPTLPARSGLPAPIAAAGVDATRRYLEFFAAQIRNANTRAAYHAAAARFFEWTDSHGLTLRSIEPLHVAAYIELLSRELAPASVKQHLAALRSLLDWLVIGQVIPFNPATSVRGPKISARTGKTPVLIEDEARTLLGSIDTDSIVGLRDRALLATMIYSFARISAVLAMRVRDYSTRGRGAFFTLHEKGGKFNEVPAHHKAAEYVDAYIAAAGIGEDRDGPLFRSVGADRSGGRRLARLTSRRFDRRSALAMIKRRARAAGLSDEIGNHSCRATGITAYLEGGGSLETAQRIADHADPGTTKLYDRTHQGVELAEIERIRI